MGGSRKWTNNDELLQFTWDLSIWPCIPNPDANPALVAGSMASEPKAVTVMHDPMSMDVSNITGDVVYQGGLSMIPRLSHEPVGVVDFGSIQTLQR